MLNQQTTEKLHALRLHGMAEAFRAQPQQAGITELSFEERLALLVDQQCNWRQNRALERRLAKAKLRHRACVEDIDFRQPRGLDRTLLRSLAQDSAWVREHQNIFLIGPTGIGKSFLACALAEKACRGWVHRLLYEGHPTVSRLSSGPRRWQFAHPARPAGPPRRAGGRRLLPAGLLRTPPNAPPVCVRRRAEG